MLNSRALSPFIGEMVEDKHLSEYTDNDIDYLKRLLFYRKAVFFENQHLTKEQLLKLGVRLKSCDQATINEEDISSVEHYDYGSGWHSDCDYFQLPPPYTIFQVNKLPENKLAGGTEFADMVSLYEYRVSSTFKSMLNNLTAIHEYTKNETQVEDGIVVRKFHTATHPVVLKTDFEDKSVNSLFVNPSHVKRIVELQPRESDAILQTLYEKIYLFTEFHYVHRWKEGSLVIWNNRLCAHRGLKDFVKDQIRIASRVVVY